jgi:hypothetical protein
MVEFEKRGLPSIASVAPAFYEDAKMSGKVFGSKNIVLRVLPGDSAIEPAERVREMAAETIDQVIDGLTKSAALLEAEAEAAKPSAIITIEGKDLLDATLKMNHEFLSKEWSDGMPLMPPTAEAVEHMLSGTRLGRDEVVAIIEPGFGIATVEKIAINAVMAGCQPEHMPVLIAMVRILADLRAFVRTKEMSTGGSFPIIWINGPIAKKLNINSGIGCCGPGSRSYANVVLGRALRLMIMNIGQAYPGVMSMTTISSPLKFGMCAAENEAENPWEPYHVEKGFDKDASTVTIMWAFSLIRLGSMKMNNAKDLADHYSMIVNQADGISGRWLMGRFKDQRDPKVDIMNDNLLFLSPDHAEILARDGWSKQNLREYLFEHCRLNYETLVHEFEWEGVKKIYPQLVHLKDKPDVLLPIVEKPDCYQIVVVGGRGPGAWYFVGSRAPVTYPIEE